MYQRQIYIGTNVTPAFLFYIKCPEALRLSGASGFACISFSTYSSRKCQSILLSSSESTFNSLPDILILIDSCDRQEAGGS